MHKGNPTSAACMFLLFLILTPVSPVCQTGTADECQRAEFVPGYSLAGGGFDITTMKRARSKIVDVDQWKNPNGTCSLCRNPWLPGYPFQKIPFSFASWDANPYCVKEVRGSVQHSVTSVATTEEETTQMTGLLGLTVPIPKYDLTVKIVLAGSHSNMVKFSRKRSLEEKSVFLLRETSCTFYRFGIREEAIISEHFKEAVKSLPEEYNSSSKQKYFHLIRTYGTHFIHELESGGSMKFLTSTYLCEVSLNDLTATSITECLAVQLAMSIGTDKVIVDGQTTAEKCKTTKTQMEFNSKFSKLHTSQYKEIVGGNPTATNIFDNRNRNSYDNWLESVKYFPGIVSCQLTPIHTLVAEQDPRREGLQKALIDYIEGKSLTIRCTNNCQAGKRPEADEDCLCTCSTDDITNNQCCSKGKRMGKLTVWIDRAYGLYGDWFTQADASVDMEFQGLIRKTVTKWDDDNPVFNEVFDFGIIHLIKGTVTLMIRVKEWDPWAISELGSCHVTVGAEQIQNKVCNFDNGHLRYRYRVVCGPNLSGPNCENFVTQKPTYSSILSNV